MASLLTHMGLRDLNGMGVCPAQHRLRRTPSATARPTRWAGGTPEYRTPERRHPSGEAPVGVGSRMPR
jgi:hypothetical protein